MGNVFILISIVFNVIGQYVLKTGVNKFGEFSPQIMQILKVMLSPLVFGGLLLYAISSVFWILALSRNDLSYAYPMLSLGYIAVILISWFALGEEVNGARILGVALITVGVTLVFKSA